MLLGWNNGNNTNFDSYEEFLNYPIFTKYSCLTQELLLKLSSNGENGIKRDNNDKIAMLFFYKRNPNSSPKL